MITYDTSKRREIPQQVLPPSLSAEDALRYYSWQQTTWLKLTRVSAQHFHLTKTSNACDDIWIGTLEELFETWTAGYLGMHDKPMVVLDPSGHYAGLWRWLPPCSGPA